MKTAELQQLEKLILAIGSWSTDNFGGQPPGNPMHGIVEELFYEVELAEDDEAKFQDCLGDAFIFSSDLIYKHGCVGEALSLLANADWCDRWALGDASIVESNLSLPAIVGAMSQVVLKTSQGIKGYGMNEKTRSELSRLWVSLYFHLDDVVHEECEDKTLLSLGQEIWDKIVSKRNWKADANTGVG